MLKNWKLMDTFKNLKNAYGEILGPESIWSGAEKGRYLAEALLVTALFAWFFYRRPFMMAVLWPIGLLYLKLRYQGCVEARVRRIRKEMKDFLSSMQMNLRTGYAAENALRETYAELVHLYGPQAYLLPHLRKVLLELSNHVPLEQALHAFGTAVGVEEAREFADMFAIAKKSGAKLSEVIEETSDLIAEKLETEDEIRTSIASKDMERKMMNIIPFLIILYIGITSPGYFDILYHSLSGMAIMTGCMAVYLVAVIWGRKLLWIPY